MTDFCVVLVTASSKEEAEKISKAILDAKLAACVNIIDKVNSFFWWEGKVDDANENLLVIKTKANQFDALSEKVKEVHSYSVPEIIALPIIKGSESYLSWIQETVQS